MARVQVDVRPPQRQQFAPAVTAGYSAKTAHSHRQGKLKPVRQLAALDLDWVAKMAMASAFDLNSSLSTGVTR